MEEVKFTISDIKVFLEDFQDWIWFDNAIYDGATCNYRRARVEDFKGKKPQMFRLLTPKGERFNKNILVNNHQLIYCNHKGEAEDEYSEDWQRFLAQKYFSSITR